MDSLGIGALEDAANFDDVGANTLGHIMEHCKLGKADKEGVRRGPLYIPNLVELGLTAAAELQPDFQSRGLYGLSREKSFSKDTSSGHWEIMGVPVLFDWGYFPPAYPSFPQELVGALIREAGIPGILGNCHASGTEIITKFGDEHIKTGKPICYTSADSVFQIAIHEEVFGLARLYEICKVAHRLVQPYKICRVIARPFVGVAGSGPLSTNSYWRTANRRDFSIAPPAPTLLDKMVEANKTVIAIGKIADIFAHRGISEHRDAHGHDEIFETVLSALRDAPGDSLTFANFVDFDMQYGHRRNVVGYAQALEEFDRRIPELTKLMQPDDIIVITADHGCDPTFKGTDHTREHIPVLIYGAKVEPGYLGIRDTFADIGQSLARYFGLEPLAYGAEFQIMMRGVLSP